MPDPVVVPGMSDPLTLLSTKFRLENCPIELHKKSVLINKKFYIVLSKFTILCLTHNYS